MDGMLSKRHPPLCGKRGAEPTTEPMAAIPTEATKTLWGEPLGIQQAAWQAVVWLQAGLLKAI